MRGWKQEFRNRMARQCEHHNWHLDPDASGPVLQTARSLCDCYLPPEHRDLTDDQIREQLRDQLRTLT
jgi:hypothetical protein